MWECVGKEQICGVIDEGTYDNFGKKFMSFHDHFALFVKVLTTT